MTNIIIKTAIIAAMAGVSFENIPPIIDFVKNTVNAAEQYQEETVETYENCSQNPDPKVRNQWEQKKEELGAKIQELQSLEELKNLDATNIATNIATEETTTQTENETVENCLLKYSANN